MIIVNITVMFTNLISLKIVELLTEYFNLKFFKYEFKKNYTIPPISYCFTIGTRSKYAKYLEYELINFEEKIKENINE